MIPRVHIAIVDNDRGNAELRQQAILEIEERLPALASTMLFSSAGEFIEAVDRDGLYFEVILTDVYMPERGGEAGSAGSPEKGGLLIKKWLQTKREGDDDFSSVQLILISRYSDVSEIIHEHVNFSTNEWVDWVSHNNSFEIMKVDLAKVIDRAIRKYNPTDPDLDLPKDFITVSPNSIEVIRQAKKVAEVDSSVLIQGQCGTGKELIAKYIHEHSQRKDKPWVAINCAAPSEGTLEDELFGHTKYAFTGAQAARQGFFAAANGGTLFLDEIGEMSTGMQAKVLRIIQEKQYHPLGSDKPMKTDFRLISATNRALDQEVFAGRFRKDLYYRIGVVELKMPPLQERREDIRPLTEYFIHFFANTDKRGVVSIASEAMAALENYDWPGNVRELRNAVERAMALVNYNGRIETSHLPETVKSGDGSTLLVGPLSPEEQIRYNAIANYGYNLAAAARSMGQSKQALNKYVKEHAKLSRIVKDAAETVKAQQASRRVNQHSNPPAFRQEDEF